MKIESARFVKSAARLAQCPRDRKAEIAFVGRSNVGKSTLMNSLLAKQGLAKTSSTPGKTQTINFFDINGKFYFVDLPGYGFAKVPLKIKDEWNRLLNEYLREREALRLVVMLVDARRTPSEKDTDMLELLEDAEVPTLVVATKVDKLKRSERKPALKAIRATLELDDDAYIVEYSSPTGEGRDELWDVLEDQLKS